MTTGDQHDEPRRIAERFLLARAWRIVAQLVRRHPELRVSGVVDDDQNVLLIVHDEAEAIRVQLDLLAWIQYDDARGTRVRIEWGDVYTERDPLAVVRRIEEETGLGTPLEASETPRGLAYRLVATVLGATVDARVPWSAQQAHITPQAPDVSSWRLFEAVPGGVEMAHVLIDRAHQEAQRRGVVLFHQPVWAVLEGGAPLLLADVDGTMLTARGAFHLPTLYETHGSMLACAAALLGSRLP